MFQNHFRKKHNPGIFRIYRKMPGDCGVSVGQTRRLHPAGSQPAAYWEVSLVDVHEI
jgi:hypothetical protein